MPTDAISTSKETSNFSHKAIREITEERLFICSGEVAVLDCFLIGSYIFSNEWEESSFLSKDIVRHRIEAAHGAVTSMSRGQYKILSSHSQKIIYALTEEDSLSSLDRDSLFADAERIAVLDRNPINLEIFTHYVALIDVAILRDVRILSEYRRLIVNGQVKESQDFLRVQGASVCEGFRRFGERLELYQDLQKTCLVVAG